MGRNKQKNNKDYPEGLGYYSGGPPGQYPPPPPYYGPPPYPQTQPPPLPPGAHMPREPFFKRIGLAGWSVLLLIPFLILLTIFLLLVFVGRPYVVHGSSMYPTLHEGDRVFVVPYRGNTTPDRGDVVVLRDVAGGNELLIKRVVALAGDKLTLSDGNVIVNDKYVHKSTSRTSTETTTRLVPDNNLFVMGDNESHSYDSRTFGPVPMSKVVGKALFIFWPLGDLKKL